MTMICKTETIYRTRIQFDKIVTFPSCNNYHTLTNIQLNYGVVISMVMITLIRNYICTNTYTKYIIERVLHSSIKKQINLGDYKLNKN